MIRPFALACIAIGVLAPQETIPDARLKALMSAVVFVKQIASSGGTTGPGFIFRCDGTTCLIATSMRSAGGRGMRTFTVYLNGGTPDERKFPAELAGENIDGDLVILRADIPDAPNPIAPAAKVLPRETMPIWLFGFGTGLEGKNPQVSISKGVVGSLRRNPAGELVQIQLDADVGAGNSGGPIVDSSGALIGITAGKFQETKIGAATPAAVLEEILAGCAFRPALEIRDNKDGVMRVAVNVPTYDPGGKLKSVTLLSMRRDALPGAIPDANGAWSQISPDMKEFVLTLQKGKAAGELFLQGDFREDAPYLVQVKYERSDGKTRVGPPDDFMAAFSTWGKQIAGPAPKRPLEEDWLGSDEDRRKWKSGAVASEETGKQLKVERTKVENVEVIRFTGVLEGRVNGVILLSPDGRDMFVAGGPEINLRKIKVPEFIEERVAPIGKTVIGAGWTKDGIAVQVETGYGPGRGSEIWTYTTTIMERIRKTSLPDSSPALTLPGQHMAVQFEPQAAKTYDMKSGKLLREITLAKAVVGMRKAEKNSGFGTWGTVEVTPDGEYAYSTNCREPVRIRVEDGEVSVEELGYPVGPIRTFVGYPDVKYALVEVNPGVKAEGHTPMPAGGLYLYKHNDFSKPVAAMPAVRPLGPGPKTGQTLAFTATGELILFDSRGRKEKSWFALPANFNSMHERRIASANGTTFVVGSHMIRITAP